MSLDKYTRLAELIKQLAPDGGTWIVQAKVTEINGDTCNVLIGNETQADTCISLTDVSLRASTAVTTNGKLLITPTIGSIVLLASLSGDLIDLQVVQVDEISKLSCKISDLIIDIDKNGLHIQNSNESLKTALNDLIEEIKKIVVIIGTSPNVAALELIKQRLNKILT